jgi:hypothetical protein
MAAWLILRMARAPSAQKRRGKILVHHRHRSPHQRRAPPHLDDLQQSIGGARTFRKLAL